MARPLRLEYSGALYHVTARGNAQQPIFLDNADRRGFLDLLGRDIDQQRWCCYAYCLMDNHYHLLFETPEPNLSRGMQRLNACYTQRFNFRHRRVGHLLQGRYKAILVQKSAHLLELCRYIVLNPVRAGVVDTPADWPWSSYAPMSGKVPCPGWLAANEVLGLFGGRYIKARTRYVKFVHAGKDADSPWAGLRGQIFLGDDVFVRETQQRIDMAQPDSEIPLAQKWPSRPGKDEVLHEVRTVYGLDRVAVLDRRNKEAFRVAVAMLRTVCNLPLKEVATLAGISVGRVSQIQRTLLNGSMNISEPMRRLREKYKVKT